MTPAIWLPCAQSLYLLQAKRGSFLRQQKASFVCVSASDAHDWSAHSPAHRSPPGKDGWIHDSFCNEGRKKKKRKSACERRNSQDHWEIIRWSGVVDLELNGIINQAKKQARCSYIYYLHVFRFRRCNKQIYVRAPDLCLRYPEAENPFQPLTLKTRRGISSDQPFFFFFFFCRMGGVLLTIIATQCPLPPN